jgi:hypothetical protein
VSINKAVKEIKFELDEIENLFDLYKEELFELNREPNPVECLLGRGAKRCTRNVKGSQRFPIH